MPLSSMSLYSLFLYLPPLHLSPLSTPVSPLPSLLLFILSLLLYPSLSPYFLYSLFLPISSCFSLSSIWFSLLSYLILSPPLLSCSLLLLSLSPPSLHVIPIHDLWLRLYVKTDTTNVSCSVILSKKLD